MKTMSQFNKLRKEIELTFHGLPYAQSTLIQSLLTLADYQTGFVKGISYQDLANLLTVHPAPGRKESGTPTKQTIRNYIKSIERECGDHFKVITEGQSLKFYFPDMPKLFSNIENNTEVNTGLNQEKTNYLIEKKEKIQDSIKEFNTEVNIDLNTEANTPTSPVKNNIFNLNNKQTETKQTTVRVNYPSRKKPINPNFYPSQETITTAQELGLDKVTDPNQIQAFINHNQKQGSKWADFNPIFIRWLEREATFTKNQQKSTGTRSNRNECHPNQNTIIQTAYDRVLQHHQAKLRAEAQGCQTGVVIEAQPINTLDSNDEAIWATFSKQTWG